MNRITNAMLTARAQLLNKLTASPSSYMDADRKILVGHFHISYAYGGACLVRTCSDGGGEQAILTSGHVSKRECYDRMNAYIQAIEDIRYGHISVERIA